jgi:hypothetical protein
MSSISVFVGDIHSLRRVWFGKPYINETLYCPAIFPAAIVQLLLVVLVVLLVVVY